jgi:hypothetical protein
MSIQIYQAKLDETDAIMQFIHEHWKQGHILSKNKKLFLYDFQDQNKLNLIIAKKENDIVGFFGFIKYNNSENPDIAGSLWKVREDIHAPFLGIQMREYFKRTIKHRFFAAPGAGLQTKAIYKAINMDWHTMEQYYLANNQLDEFQLLKNPLFNPSFTPTEEISQIYQATSINDLKGYVFDTEIVPLKDLNYIKKRFFKHPIYKYDVYYVKVKNTIKNIFVCRVARANESAAYRIVDFYGNLDFINNITSFLYQLIIKNGIEYIDFINYGYEQEKLLSAGFSLLDFTNQETIVPNYFEPFVQMNVPIYCVSDKTDKIFRQHKADGDQDRPNFSEIDL